MRESFAYQDRLDRLERAILSSVKQFRLGNDHLGLDHFLHSIDDLEILIECQQYSGEPQGHLDKIIIILDKLYEAMKNKDVLAMTDLLECKLYPLMNQWGRGEQG
ncbi:hypothetical protein [Alteribacillus bidgolensis]|uniref:Uncharacterized protein n=1 Tax=Alteribacillus bidgolensis TaxID=930129 RepID=A0A1G8JHX6_9BACI|nr:hypothetical protein [Alteribacillus bidgolensis]SDI30884.1 hypothetical protein SAMN05216352_106208 [Alteribacillus bidgolensis]